MIAGMKANILAPASPLRRRNPSPQSALLGALLGALLLASGCVYRLPIQQGNHLDPEKIGLIKAGMTRTQVRYLLGTPIVPGGFDNDRWDYEYYLKVRRLQTPTQSHATVYFKEDLVDHVVSNVKEQEVAEPRSRRPVNAPGA
jgi:outer membrane protein assembly factor BamE